MTIRVTNEVDEKFVSGDYNTAAVFLDHMLVGIGGIPDITLTAERAADLRDVLDAAVGLTSSGVVLTEAGEAALDRA